MQRTFKKNQPIKEEWGSPDPNHQGGQFKKMSNWYFQKYMWVLQNVYAFPHSLGTKKISQYCEDCPSMPIPCNVEEFLEGHRYLFEAIYIVSDGKKVSFMFGRNSNDEFFRIWLWGLGDAQYLEKYVNRKFYHPLSMLNLSFRWILHKIISLVFYSARMVDKIMGRKNSY